MIIRKDVTMTQKASTLNSCSARRTLNASPLNSWAVRSTPGYDKCTASTPESPIYAVGALFQSAFRCPNLSAGSSDAAAIERRRFQRPSHVFSD